MRVTEQNGEHQKLKGKKSTGQLVCTKFDFLPDLYIQPEYENSNELPHNYF